MKKKNKLTAKLAEQLEQTAPSDLLEIVLELEPRAERAAALETRPRSEKIAALKEAFSRDMTPIEEAIRKVGGEVTGSAWINQTVRARVPAQGVKELSEYDKVVALDIPRLIRPDFS